MRADVSGFRSAVKDAAPSVRSGQTDDRFPLAEGADLSIGRPRPAADVQRAAAYRHGYRGPLRHRDEARVAVAVLPFCVFHLPPVAGLGDQRNIASLIQRRGHRCAGGRAASHVQPPGSSRHDTGFGIRRGRLSPHRQKERSQKEQNRYSTSQNSSNNNHLVLVFQEAYSPSATASPHICAAIVTHL